MTPKNQFTIQINVTNTPSFNAFEFALYYDPHYLNALSVDVTGSTGTQTVFGNHADAFKNDVSNRGVIYEAVIGLGDAGIFPGGNGVLANVVFNITGTGVSPLTLAAGMFPSSFAQDARGKKPVYTDLATTNAAGYTYYIGVDTSDGYFTNVAGTGQLGPIAKFTTFPQPAEQGRAVTFDATASFDPDHPLSGILRYVWDFGDGGSENNTVPMTSHPYVSPGDTRYLGNFTVRLTVVDIDNGFQGMSVKRIEIVRPPKHDVAVFAVTATPASITPGQQVTVRVILKNQGTFPENYNLSVSYGPPTTFIHNETGRGLAASGTVTYSYMLNTTKLKPNTYTVVATVHIPFANDTSDEVGRTLFVVAWPSNAPFLYLLSGGAGIVALVSVGGFLARRRRLKLAEIEDDMRPRKGKRSR
ncbi:MAG TPA: PKD domain-containing protein [Candidatus Bathyarchaeia archaeon]|nr:PKD domain-containing protein [Candidatus Bathyarchaeia archaeon]